MLKRSKILAKYARENIIALVQYPLIYVYRAIFFYFMGIFLIADMASVEYESTWTGELATLFMLFIVHVISGAEYVKFVNWGKRRRRHPIYVRIKQEIRDKALAKEE